MKYLIFLILFMVSSYRVSCQNAFNNECADQIENCEKLNDSIAILTSYRLYNRIDTTAIINFFQNTLKDNYPHWLNMEIASLRDNKDLTMSILTELSKKSLPTELNTYVRNQIEYSNILNDIQHTPEKFVDAKESETDELLQIYFDVKKKVARGNTDSLIVMSNQMLENVSRSTYPMIQLNILTKALNHSRGKLSDSSYYLINKAVEISESIPETYYRAFLYNIKQMKLGRQGNFKGAIEAGQHYLELATLEKDTSEIINAHLNLSSYHQEIGQYDEAYERIDSAKQIATIKNDSTAMIRCQASIAFAKMNEDKNDEAITILKECLKAKNNIETYDTGLIYLNLIDCFASSNKQDSAYLYFQKLEQFDPNNYLGLLDYSKSLVVNHLISEGNYTLAQEYINTTLADAEAYNDIPTKSLALLAQSNLDEAKGQYQKALYNYKEHRELEKSLTTQEKISEITTVKLKGEFEKEKAILALKQDQEQALLKAKQTKTIILGIGAFLGLLLLSIFYFFLRKKNKALASLNNVKDTLFQIIGHDLKKPTINFRNVSKNINYLIEKEDFKRLKMLGEEVDQDAKSLYNLTDNLLNWALMQKDTISIKPERINVHEIVNYNFDLFANLSKRKGITLENHVGKEVFSLVDRNSIDTIVRNLIDNAIKYTPSGGKISLNSKVTDGTVRLSIIDTGIGMDQSIIDAINNEQTIKSKIGTEGEKGSGIGLQLVKSLIAKNNGNLKILSISGNGSTMIVDFPMAS